MLDIVIMQSILLIWVFMSLFNYRKFSAFIILNCFSGVPLLHFLLQWDNHTATLNSQLLIVIHLAIYFLKSFIFLCCEMGSISQYYLPIHCFSLAVSVVCFILGACHFHALVPALLIASFSSPQFLYFFFFVSFGFLISHSLKMDTIS